MKNIPEDLSNKIKTPLQTPANNADPKMSITVVRAKDTIMDNTYWTTEVIRTGTDLGDVSVAPRRFTPYGSPNRIYEIHVQNGIVSASIREYPDKLKEGWKEQFTLGPGKSVGIAFDGEWKRYKQTYRLVTYEKPWISWVDLNGILWAQRWDEENTRIQLSADVVKVRMIRAWKNTAIDYLDQGIVAAYIKTDGKVYYRNYAIQENYDVVWEYEKEVVDFTGTAVNVNLFITNDYRMGFIIEDSDNKIHWSITVRNWGGMASPAESLTTEISDLQFNVTDIRTTIVDTKDAIMPNLGLGFTPVSKAKIESENLSTSVVPIHFNVCPISISPLPSITGVDRLGFIDGKTIALTFNYDLECDLVRLKKGLSLKTTAGNIIEIANVTQDGNVLTIHTAEKMRLMDNVTLTYSDIGNYFLALRINETCVLDYGQPINLTILGAPPEVQENLPIFIDATFNVLPIVTIGGFEEEHLVSAVEDLNFTVTEVDTRTGMVDENLTSGVSNITFVVTQIGTSPI